MTFRTPNDADFDAVSIGFRSVERFRLNFNCCSRRLLLMAKYAKLAPSGNDIHAAYKTKGFRLKTKDGVV